MAMSGVFHRLNTCVSAQPAALNAAGSLISIQHKSYPSGNRDLHQTTKRWSSKSTAEKRYTLNYHKLKEGGAFGASRGHTKGILHEQDKPDTVVGNVKNVQGWRSGAERGFLGCYTDIIHQVGSNQQFPELTMWYTKVLSQNLTSSVLGKRRFGLLVPIVYYQLKDAKSQKPSREEMKSVHALAWAVELLRASQLVTADTIGINDTRCHVNHKHTLSQTPKTPVTSGGDPTWAEKHELGSRAFNDALLLQTGAHELVRQNFMDNKNFYLLSDSLSEAFRVLNMGQSMMLRITANGAANDMKARLSQVDGNTYKKLVKFNKTHPKYILPMQLALFAAGFDSPQIHKQAETVLNDIGYLAEVTGDFANAFYDETGRDIEDGRLTWLIVNAYQRAKPSQKTALEESYGTAEAGKADIVRQIYEDLKLRKMCGTVIEDIRKDMMTYIQQLGATGLPPTFFFGLLDNMENMA